MEKNQCANSTSKQINKKSRADGLIVNSPVTANSQSNAGYCDSSGAQPSNTAPPNCIETTTSILHTGIDSLYLSYSGTLHPEIEKKLEQCKNYAQSTDPEEQAKAVIYLVDHNFMVKPTGKGKYAYVIVDNWFHIQVARSTTTQIPMVYIQISSELLTGSDIPRIIVNVNNLVHTIGKDYGTASVSRVDICTDFTTGIDIASLPHSAWVSRSDKFNAYYERKQLTGYVFGEGSPISCRLYNKTVELKKSKKTYLEPIWQKAGWNGTSEVWRLEYQYRRQVLRELQILNINNLINKLSLLWAYSTEDWLKLTLPSTTDTTQSRWPLHPLWLKLITASWSGETGAPLMRIRKQRLPNDDQLFINGLSAITSIMARDGLADFDEAMEAYKVEAHAFHRDRSRLTNETLNQYARGKAFQKARRYNTLSKKQRKAGYITWKP
jgi:hypothetical protein